MPQRIACPDCHGTAWVPSDWVGPQFVAGGPCPACDGTGYELTCSDCGFELTREEREDEAGLCYACGDRQHVELLAASCTLASLAKTSGKHPGEALCAARKAVGR